MRKEAGRQPAPSSHVTPGQDQPVRRRSFRTELQTGRQHAALQRPRRGPLLTLLPGDLLRPSPGGIHAQTPGGGPGAEGPIHGACWSPHLKACPHRYLCLACPPAPWLACPGLCPSSLAWVSRAGSVPVTACHLGWSPWLLDREHFERPCASAPKPHAPQGLN